MVCFQASMRLMIAGTPSMMRAVASRTWANRSRLPLCRMEKLPKSADCTIEPVFADESQHAAVELVGGGAVVAVEEHHLGHLAPVVDELS